MLQMVSIKMEIYLDFNIQVETAHNLYFDLRKINILKKMKSYSVGD